MQGLGMGWPKALPDGEQKKIIFGLKKFERVLKNGLFRWIYLGDLFCAPMVLPWERLGLGGRR